MKSSFDSSLIESGDIIKRGTRTLLENLGKVVAVLTALVASLVIFTEISFSGFGTEGVTSTLLILLGASYIIYFSLEDAAERSAKSSEDFIKIEERYESLRAKISGEDIDALRKFCNDYAGEELKYRREAYLLSRGLSPSGYEAFIAGGAVSQSERRAYARAKKMRPVPLSPKLLLSEDKARGKSELRSPEGDKLTHFVLRLLPTTLCMVFTVSVALSLREGLTPESVIEGILKLSTLPLAAYKGYTGGWGYVSGPLSDWERTRADILDTFLKEKSKQ